MMIFAAFWVMTGMIGAAIISSPALSNDLVRQHIPNAEYVGEGRLVYLFFDVYDATLYAPGGDWSEEEPLALSLDYLREIDGKKIADRSLEEMERLSGADKTVLNEWYQDMLQIFPDVVDGSNITGILSPSGESIFYFGGQEAGRVKDPEFGKYFFAIWLSPETSSPDLRRKLLGVR